MKRILTTAFMLSAALVLGLSSCKKSDNNGGGTPASDLTVGRSAISYNSSSNIGGSNSFSEGNTALCTATSMVSGATRGITLRATEVSGMDTRSVVIYIQIDNAENTSSGDIVSAFDTPTGEFWGTMSISSTSGTSVNDTYVAKSGPIKITKLTNTEIEGEFSGIVEDDPVTSSITISNGYFAGKF